MIRYIERKYLSASSPSNSRKTAGIIMGAVGIGLNIVLFAIKLIAGRISGSIAITADCFNNLADSGVCFMSLLGFALGGLRPCRRFPFGLGRFEYLSGLFISAAVMILGIRMTVSSIAKIISPEPINGAPEVIVMLAVSIAIKGYVFYYNLRIGRRIGSAGMKAAAMDSLSDCAATLAIIAAIIIENITGLNIDGYAGAIVAMCIIWAGAVSAKESVEPLIGMGIDEDIRERIEAIARRHSDIIDVYDIAMHDYGPQKKLVTMFITTSGRAGNTAAQLRREIYGESGLSAIICAEEAESCKAEKEIVYDSINHTEPVKNNHVQNRRT